jgi:5-(carboxyamino)imidazole ribonucleotide synthase
MLVGAIDYEGARFRIHAHVIPSTSDELHELRTFRDALRRDADLRERYVAAKQRIVDAGERSGQMYAVIKGDFVSDTMLAIGAWRRPADQGPPIEPGATIGILGGGQLGRMLGVAARQLGYGVAILDPDPFCPARAVADRQVEAAYDSAKGARELAAGCAVVTYELEHVSAEAVETAAGLVPVRPGLAALRATQDRLAERRFVREQGELTAEWRAVRGPVELRAAADELGYPLRLKAPIGGYDGRSQARIAGPDDLAGALATVERQEGTAHPLLLERELAFDAELSVVVARDLDGRTLAYPVSRNLHDAGILVESVAPAPIDPIHAASARDIAARLARALDVVGVMTVELFLVDDRDLAVNELAPRVHNSGHWTIEGATTSQFQQHVRAICGLPLGSVEPRGAAAMVNLLGSGRKRPARLTGLPDALADPSVAVHVYGKRAVFERRKMGHVTSLAPDGDADAALDRARAAVARLGWAE